MLGDRADEHPGEGAVALAAHHEQLGTGRGRDQSGGRVALGDDSLHGDLGPGTRIGPEDVADRLVQNPAGDRSGSYSTGKTGAQPTKEGAPRR